MEKRLLADAVPEATGSETASSAPPPPLADSAWHRRAAPNACFAVRQGDLFADDVFQVGPWLAEAGQKDLQVYLMYAQASGLVDPALCRTCCYAKHLADDGAAATEPFGWFCNMHVVRLGPPPSGGCLVYSPVLGPDGSAETIKKELQARDLLPVRMVVAPNPAHHLALSAFQRTFPDALYLCGQGSEQKPPLTEKRPDLRFDGLFAVGNDAALLPPPGSSDVADERLKIAAELLKTNFKVCVCEDERSTEVVLYHCNSKTLLISDLLYRASTEIVGPGGPDHRYTAPEWFGQGQDELFYRAADDPSGNLLPTYRTHPQVVRMDAAGMRRSLLYILSWDFEHCIGCHIDRLEGNAARELLTRAWAWVLEESSQGAAERAAVA
ncbi:unnamed protein product [Polarella glacialis]|uniref:Uncharacterized protein n=1 Tax=Polarella glacialis TaxID=89957 RepID=A0A813JG56_POLGL|nr:unnamed protein product [Polarella glacialis]